MSILLAWAASTWLGDKLGRSLAPLLAGAAVAIGALLLLWIGAASLTSAARTARDSYWRHTVTQAGIKVAAAQGARQRRAAAAEARQREAEQKAENLAAELAVRAGTDRVLEHLAKLPPARPLNPLLYPAEIRATPRRGAK